jgi:hypothetical protein
MNENEIMLKELIGITRSNAESTAVTLQDLNHLKNIVKGMNSKTNENSSNIATLQDDMENLKQNEEITEDQAIMIVVLARKRIAAILGYPSEDSEIYFMTFIQALYGDMRRSHGMGGAYRRTKKKNYQNVIDGIEAWYPRDKQALKDKVDRRLEIKNKINLY